MCYWLVEAFRGIWLRYALKGVHPDYFVKLDLELVVY